MKSIIALLFIITVAYATEQACITSAGYSWCAFEGKCIRPWELAREKNIKMTPENIESYCNGKKMEGAADANGCISSAGYSWCAKENKCVRPWELATEKSVSIKTVQDFNNYCKNATEVGADADVHGCAASEGYSWCKKENKCVKPWELAKLRNIAATPASIGSYCAACIASAGYSYCQTEDSCVKPWEFTKLKNIDNTPEAFDEYCTKSVPAPKPIGGASGAHACVAGAGYSWCQAESKCVRPWELAKLRNIANTAESVSEYCNRQQVIGAADANGCIAGAGYSWCPRVNKCVQPWELALEQNIKDLTPESFNSWCTVAQ